MEIRRLILLLMIIVISSCSTLNISDAIFVTRNIERNLKFNNNLFEYLQFDNNSLKATINRKCLSENFSTEIEKMSKLLTQKPTSFLQLEIGLCYQLAGEFPKAFYYYDQGLAKIKPSKRRLKGSVYNNLGVMFAKRDQFDTAYRYLEKALIEVPNNFISVYNLSLILTAIGRYEESISLISKFNGSKGELIQLNKILGLNYISLNDINSLQAKVLNKFDDNLSEKKFLRAVSKFIKSGDSKVAYELIKDLDDLNPIYQELYNNIILLLKKKIREDETRKTNTHIRMSRGFKVFSA
jgi:tetratricopeptide (TPR) repeat protein